MNLRKQNRIQPKLEELLVLCFVALPAPIKIGAPYSKNDDSVNSQPIKLCLNITYHSIISHITHYLIKFTNTK